MGILEKVFGKTEKRKKIVDTTLGPIEFIVPGSNRVNEWAEANKTQLESNDGWMGVALILRDFSTVKEFNMLRPEEIPGFIEEMKKTFSPRDFKAIFGYWYWLYGVTTEEVSSMLQSPDFQLKR